MAIGQALCCVTFLVVFSMGTQLRSPTPYEGVRQGDHDAVPIATTTAAPPVHIAWLVSGQLSRFTYKNTLDEISRSIRGSLRGFACGGAGPATCTVDVIGVITDTRSFVFSGNRSLQPPPYVDDATSISDLYWQQGADYVDIQIIPQDSWNESSHRVTNLVQEIASYTDSIKSAESWWTKVKALPLYSYRYNSCGNMFLARHAVYSHAMAMESTRPYRYSHFLYVREDNVFVNPTYTLIDLVPKTKDVLVDTHCHFLGFYSDKIYFMTAKAASFFFGETLRAHAGLMFTWLDRAVRGESQVENNGLKRDPLQTEEFLQFVLDKAGVHVDSFDFERTEVRYVNGKACVLSLYFKCTQRPGVVFPFCRD